MVATFHGMPLRVTACSPNDAMQALDGGLNGTLVDIRADPAAAQLLGDGSSCAGAKETVQHDVIQDLKPLQLSVSINCLWFLGTDSLHIRHS